jgi:hypothetical protein
MSAIIAIALVLAIRVPAWSQEGDEANHVHFLIVADTLDSKSKLLGLDLDSKSMQETLRKALGQQGYREGKQGRFTITVLEGTNASEQRIFHYYRNLQAAPKKDTLVFYYTGHGGFYIDRGHRFNLKNWLLEGGKTKAYAAEVDRSDLMAAMARHEPRALIVLTDCCATVGAATLASERKQTKEDAFNDLAAFPEGNGEVVRDLFYRSKGVINITAARTGTPASGDRKKGGSFFTVALVQILRAGSANLDRNGNQVVEWDEVFPALARRTEKESWRPVAILKGDGKRIGEVHTPEWFLLGQPARNETGDPEEKWKTLPPLPVIEDELARKDPMIQLRKDHQGYAKEYPVQLEAGQAYLFRLHSAHFDSFLYIKDAKGKIVAADDDYGGTTRSRIVFRPAATGKFLVGVTSYVSRETGRFTLTAQRASYVGELTRSDPKDRYRNGSHVRQHAIHLKAGRTYTISLEAFAKEFDTFLRIEDRFGNTLAMNDDEDESSRFNSLISFRPNFSGTYYLLVNSMRPDQTGPYALFIQD